MSQYARSACVCVGIVPTVLLSLLYTASHLSRLRALILDLVAEGSDQLLRCRLKTLAAATAAEPIGPSTRRNAESTERLKTRRQQRHNHSSADMEH